MANQAHPRIRIETEAVLVLLGTDASRVTLAWRAERVRSWLGERSLLSREGEALKARTAELMANGLRGFDALHLACAEAAGADLFVTCDDRLLAAALRLGSKIKVRVEELTAVAREVLS